MKNVLIAPNSFKECINSVKLASLIDGFLPKDKFRTILLPISDGGDGFLDVVAAQQNLKIITTNIPSPCNTYTNSARWGLNNDTKTAFIETATVVGLSQVAAEFRKPPELNTSPLGLLIKEISKYELNKIVIGIGGTATVDMGIGALSELGLKIQDAAGYELKPIPENYVKAANFSFNGFSLPVIEFITDVSNSLLGPEGAAQIYGPQKGASAEDIKLLEKGFINLIRLFRNDLNDVHRLSGAGGGIPVGFKLFYETLETSSENFIFEQLNNLNQKFDFIITGEGAFDEQTLMDKGVLAIIKFAEKTNTPVVVFCGINNLHNSRLNNVKIIELSEFFTDISESVKNIDTGIKLAVDKMINDIDTKEHK